MLGCDWEMNNDDSSNRYVKFLTKKESKMVDNFIFNIFISYSTKDLDKIKPVINQLSIIQNTKIFCADKSIYPGDNINQTIIDSIKNSALS